MADITFTCGQCGQELEAPAELAGEVVECPSCNASIAVPESDGEMGMAAPASVGDAAELDNACPECGAELEPDAVLCIECGFHKGLGKKIDTSFG